MDNNYNTKQKRFQINGDHTQTHSMCHIRSNIMGAITVETFQKLDAKIQNKYINTKSVVCSFLKGDQKSWYE